MHFVFSYDLSIDAGIRRNEVVAQIEGLLPANNFVRRLSTFYIVHVDNVEEWNTILSNMTNLSRGIPETFHFIMSPCTTGGRYNGILPRNEWDAINNLSD